MRREKFIYNTHTLRYERVEESRSTKFLRIFGFICAAVFTAAIFAVISHRYLPSPKERALQNELQQVTAEYQRLEGELDKLSEVLGSLRDRDAYAHRMIFGMEPIDDGVWEGGIGGHDEYEKYRQFKNTGELLVDVRQKVDQLKLQMAIQSKSLDTIMNLATDQEKMFASIPSIKPVRADLIRNGRRVNELSGFGMRHHPVLKRPRMHYGIDFTARRGTPIYATGSGKVVRNEYSRSYGNVVVIDHGYGFKSLYAHMQKSLVKYGQEVSRGEKIGLVGSTGRSIGPHCHYEVMLRGKKVDPIHYVLDGLSPEDYQELVEASKSSNQSFDY